MCVRHIRNDVFLETGQDSYEILRTAVLFLWG